jgi:hypothetical protein
MLVEHSRSRIKKAVNADAWLPITSLSNFPARLYSA